MTATQCHYVFPRSTAEAWLTTWDLLNDEPSWCWKRCRFTGEICRVAIDRIGSWHVSTVLIDSRRAPEYQRWRERFQHLYSDDYETLVTSDATVGEWGANWHTRDQALLGHWLLCDLLRIGMAPTAALVAIEPPEDECALVN